MGAFDLPIGNRVAAACAEKVHGLVCGLADGTPAAEEDPK
jgi:hypothetical protein